MTVERKERWPTLADSTSVAGFDLDVYAEAAILRCPIDPYSDCCGGATAEPVLSVEELRELREELSWAIVRLEGRLA